MHHCPLSCMGQWRTESWEQKGALHGLARLLGSSRPTGYYFGHIHGGAQHWASDSWALLTHRSCHCSKFTGPLLPKNCLRGSVFPCQRGNLSEMVWLGFAPPEYEYFEFVTVTTGFFSKKLKRYADRYNYDHSIITHTSQSWFPQNILISL